MTKHEILSNPYTTVEKLHNEGIDFVMNSISPDPAIEEVIALSAKYMQTLSGNDSKEADANYYVSIANL